MFILLPDRYQAPKWLAPVLPRSHAFVFSDGSSVVNLFELKQVLGILDDSLLTEQVNEKEHHIADWVETCIQDSELATELRAQPHRWGMIVALERHMMRTLNLPNYVAARWLQPVESPFVYVSGETFVSLDHLKLTLNQVSDDTINFHLERYPNDIALWVEENIGDTELSQLLNECTNRTQMLNYVTDHLEMLKDAAQ